MYVYIEKKNNRYIIFNLWNNEIDWALTLDEAMKKAIKYKGNGGFDIQVIEEEG